MSNPTDDDDQRGMRGIGPRGSRPVDDDRDRRRVPDRRATSGRDRHAEGADRGDRGDRAYRQSDGRSRGRYDDGAGRRRADDRQAGRYHGAAGAAGGRGDRYGDRDQGRYQDPRGADRYSDHDDRHDGRQDDRYDDRYRSDQRQYQGWYDDDGDPDAYDRNDRYDRHGDQYDDERLPGQGHRRRATKRRRPLRIALIVLAFTFVIGLVGSVAAFAIGYSMTKIPNENELVTSNSSILYYSDGKTVLGSFAAEQNRISVDLEDVPKPVQDAVIAAENRTFWTDKGVDPIGIARAAMSTAGGTTQGASTITQQYVKNFYLTPERTMERKVNELFITLKVQRELSKETILERYLNTTYFGRGSWGIQTASQAFFGKDVKNLTVEEGAVLASLLKAPNNYDPAITGGTRRLEGRFRWVLGNLEEMGAVAKGSSKTAQLPKIKPVKSGQKYAGPKGYLLASAKQAAKDLGYDDKQLQTGGLRITTTFDAKAQRALEQAVAKNFPTKNADGLHVGAAAVRPGTGEIVAMYGGKDYLKQEYNDATQAQIQPGSTFKAFGLVAALEQGLSLQSRFAGNTPYWVGDRHTKVDKVVNLDNEDFGRSVDLVKATESSINTAFVDMVENNLGARKVLDAAVRAGVPENAPGMDQVVPKAVLGQASVRPVDMANAYATFASGGFRAKRHLIAKVTDADGILMHEAEPKVEKVFESDVVREVSWALQRVVSNGSGKREASKIGRPAAGKTGTHEKETSWFVGYTPQLSTAVAFYKDKDWDGQKESLVGVGGEKRFTGGEYPARVWAAFMKDALQGQKVENFPPRSKMGKALNPKPKKTPRRNTPAPGPTTPVPDPTVGPNPDPDPEPTGPPDPEPSHTPPPDPEPTYSPPPDPKPTKSSRPDPTPEPRPTFTKRPYVDGGDDDDDDEGWDPGWPSMSISVAWSLWTGALR